MERLFLRIVHFCGRLFRQSSQTALETTIVAGLVGDGERDGGCVCLDFDFLQLRGVAGIGDVGEKRKCHIFANLSSMFLTKLARRTYSVKCSLNISAVRLFRFMRQRYGTAEDWEKIGLKQIKLI